MKNGSKKEQGLERVRLSVTVTKTALYLKHTVSGTGIKNGLNINLLKLQAHPVHLVRTGIHVVKFITFTFPLM